MSPCALSSTQAQQHSLPQPLLQDKQVISGDTGPQAQPCLHSSLPSSYPPQDPSSSWRLLTQGSIQVLEDAAAVIQGDVDPCLQ